MPGTTTVEELELVHGGVPPGGGADGSGGEGGERGPGRSGVPARAYFTGMSLALVGILMFFMAFASSYIVRKGESDWQPVSLPRILLLNTAVLILSSLTIEKARAALKKGLPGDFRHWWAITTLLGAFFLAGQVAAWSQLAAAGVFLRSNPSSSFFYVLTGVHGLHLLGGLVALVYVMLRNWSAVGVRLPLAAAAEVTSIYWHFMDLLWLFLLLLLYLGR